MFRWGISLLIALTAAAAISAQTEESPEAKAFYKLTTSAPAAYLHGDSAKAAALAKQLLETAPVFPRNWNYGNAIHSAHIVLGRIAADAGDLAEARRQLLESASIKLPEREDLGPLLVKASPQLDSFGPDMTLARALLEKGERDTVLKYLDACAEFWSQKDQIAEWRAQVVAGKTPDFGPNLRYVFEKIKD